MLLVIFLTVLTVVLVSCDGVKPFPKVSLWLTESESQSCIEFVLVDQERLLFKPSGREKPLDQCFNHFCLSSKDTTQVLNWARDLKSAAQNRCR